MTKRNDGLWDENMAVMDNCGVLVLAFAIDVMREHENRQLSVKDETTQYMNVLHIFLKYPDRSPFDGLLTRKN